MTKLEKALELRELRKAKYLKRTGTSGNYKYIYKEEQGRLRKENRTGKASGTLSENMEFLASMISSSGLKNGDPKSFNPEDAGDVHAVHNLLVAQALFGKPDTNEKHLKVAKKLIAAGHLTKDLQPKSEMAKKYVSNVQAIRSHSKKTSSEENANDDRISRTFFKLTATKTKMNSNDGKYTLEPMTEEIAEEEGESFDPKEWIWKNKKTGEVESIGSMNDILDAGLPMSNFVRKKRT